MNKVELLGRLTNNIELRYTKNNIMVTNFTLAVNRKYVKANEEKQADFINIIAWNKLAEFCSKYFQKGQQIVIVGKIQTRTYEDNENKKHYITEIVAEEAYFADSRRGDSEGSASGSFENTFGAEVNEAGSEFELTSNDDLPF